MTELFDTPEAREARVENDRPVVCTRCAKWNDQIPTPFYRVRTERGSDAVMCSTCVKAGTDFKRFR